MKSLRILLPAILLSFGTQASGALPTTHPGDILLPTFDGRVVLYHPENGTWEDYASLGAYHQPTGIVREPSGNFLISDYPGTILRLDATTGAVSVVAPAGGIATYRAEDLTLGADGAIYVAEANDIGRVDPVTGAATIVSASPFWAGICGIKAGANGLLFFVSESLAKIDWENPVTKQWAHLAQYPAVLNPMQLEFQQDGSLLVFDNESGPTALLRVDPVSGASTKLADGPYDFWMRGIARDANAGDYLAGAPGGFLPTTGTLFHFDGTTLTPLADFPFGLRGIYVFPGTGPVPTQNRTWGGIKGLYR
jgi:hypothetical protein